MAGRIRPSVPLDSQFTQAVFVELAGLVHYPSRTQQFLAGAHDMSLSIVVIFHDMRREAKRTLHSLSADYQIGLRDLDYEVIAIDNGSSEPLDSAWVRSIGPQFSHHYFETDSISPVAAVNWGLEIATKEHVALIIDGARMASPGLVGHSQEAIELYPESFSCALSWHLGPDIQNRSMLNGYSRQTEDALLDSIGWPGDGYRLFDISTIASSSNCGFLGGIPPECSWWVMKRDTFFRIGGFDERFLSGGGGLVNQEFRERVVQQPDLTFVALLGEGVFHQIHGGVATNVKITDHPIGDFKQEYEQIRGIPYKPTASPETRYLGGFRPNNMRFTNLRARGGDRKA